MEPKRNEAISAACLVGECTDIAHTPIDWPACRERDYLCDSHAVLLGEMVAELSAILVSMSEEA